jgi:hypothetical protein
MLGYFLKGGDLGALSQVCMEGREGYDQQMNECKTKIKYFGWISAGDHSERALNVNSYLQISWDLFSRHYKQIDDRPLKKRSRMTPFLFV